MSNKRKFVARESTLRGPLCHEQTAHLLLQRVPVAALVGLILDFVDPAWRLQFTSSKDGVVGLPGEEELNVRYHRLCGVPMCHCVPDRVSASYFNGADFGVGFYIQRVEVGPPTSFPAMRAGSAYLDNGKFYFCVGDWWCWVTIGDHHSDVSQFIADMFVWRAALLLRRQFLVPVK
jgi:hypothetical protein